MEITIELLLKGKSTIIKDKEFLATSDYVKPFLDEMKKFTNNFIVNVVLPDQLTVTNKSEDLTFNKVWIQAIMPEKCRVGDYDEVYNLTYALDVKTPVYKVFRSYIHKDSKAMLVTDWNWITSKELKPKETLNYSIKSLMEYTNNFSMIVNKMSNTWMDVDAKSKQFRLGEVLDKVLTEELKTISGKVKVSPNYILKAYENLHIDVTSKHYVDSKIPNLLTYLEPFIEALSLDKDIINRFEKTMLIFNSFYKCK